MKKIYTRRLSLFISALGFICFAKAQNIKLLTQPAYTSSAPKYYTYDTSVNPGFAVYKGICYFTATIAPRNIRQLWRSDGTAEGTYAVGYPGFGPVNNVFDIEVINNTLYTLGTQFCTIEDTTKNAFFSYTNLASSNSPTNVVLFNGFFYYVSNGVLLNINGTKKFILDASYSSERPSAHLTLVKNAMVINLFKIENLTSTAYISDGTQFGTVPLDISVNDRQLTALGDSLYFVHGDSLYTNPSSPDPGSSKLANNPLGATVAKAYTNKPIPVLNGDLYFAAQTASTGMELFKYSPSAGAITLVKDVLPGAASAGIDFNTMVKVGNMLFFTAIDGNGNKQLWKSDGTDAGTVLVKNFNDTAATFSNFTDVNGALYFSYVNATYGNELWKSDGTETGTLLIKDIAPGVDGSNPVYITPGVNQAFFMANDGVHGSELWKTDGTDAGTQLVKDINTSQTIGQFNMRNFTQLKDNIVFTATDYSYGTHLWVTNGTQAGTGLLKDIFPATAPADPSVLLSGGDGSYFIIDSTAAGLHQLWKTNGTAAGTSLVKRFNNYSVQPFYISGTINNLGFFWLSNDNHKELWRTDGTDIGTFKITDLATSTDVNNIQFSVLGNTGYFANGTDLWKTDGTVAGTVMEHHFLVMPSLMFVLNNNTLLIFTGPDFWVLNNNSLNQAGSLSLDHVQFLQVIKNRLFFYELTDKYDQDGNFSFTNFYLKAIDAAGSIQDIHDFGSAPPQKFVLSGGRIYFIEATPDAKLSILDDITGTITNTTKNFKVSGIINGNEKLYFTTFYANSSDYSTNGIDFAPGYSDGTYQGTQIIVDSTSPFDNAGNLMVVNNHLVFIASPLPLNKLYYDLIFGPQLFGYEIPAAPLPITLTNFTAKLQKGNGLLNWSTTTEQNSDYFSVLRSTDGLHFTNIGKVAAAGNSNYSQQYAYTDYDVVKLGFDKVDYRLQQFDKDGKFSYSKIAMLTINTGFTVSLSPIPVATQLTVSIVSAKKQTVLIAITDMAGKTITSAAKPVEAGSTTLTYSAASWAKGIYQVHITQANSNKQTFNVVR